MTNEARSEFDEVTGKRKVPELLYKTLEEAGYRHQAYHLKNQVDQWGKKGV